MFPTTNASSDWCARSCGYAETALCSASTVALTSTETSCRSSSGRRAFYKAATRTVRVSWLGAEQAAWRSSSDLVARQGVCLHRVNISCAVPSWVDPSLGNQRLLLGGLSCGRDLEEESESPFPAAGSVPCLCWAGAKGQQREGMGSVPVLLYWRGAWVRWISASSHPFSFHGPGCRLKSAAMFGKQEVSECKRSSRLQVGQILQKLGQKSKPTLKQLRRGLFPPRPVCLH